MFIRFKYKLKDRMDMNFYDLYVPVDDIEEAVETAMKMNFSGIGPAHRYDNKKMLNKYLEEMDNLGGDLDIDLVRCCEIKADNPRDMKNKIGKTRQKVDVILVKGGNFDINTAATRDRRVDILLHPEHRRKDTGMDHKTAKMAAEKNVTIGFVMHDLHQTYGKVRSHVINHIRKSIELCEKYGVQFIVVSGARDIYGMRGPRELASLPKVLGVDPSKAMDTVSTVPHKIVKNNRKKLGGRIKKGGVERL